MAERQFTFEEMDDLGVVQEVNRRMLHPIGLALSRREDGTLIINETDDPEGWRFARFDLNPRANAFRAREAEYRNIRREALGYFIQPLN